MYKFAHLSDCHLGAWKYPKIQELEIETFKKIIDDCIEDKVNFIIISGDLFHANLPDLGVVREAVKKLKKASEAGIPVYVVYGSHDFSPNENSIIDIIIDAGLLIKVKTGVEINRRIKLEFIKDQSTGVKLVGISGRKMSLDKQYYQKLDRNSLEKEQGFKIFILHIGLDELKPEILEEMESIPISFLPKKFNYYAGGHIHKSSKKEFPGYGPVCYPGTPFAGYVRDLEASSKDLKRGYFIVEFDNEIRNIKFQELDLASYLYYEYDASGKNVNKVQDELEDEIQKLDVKNKIVFLKLKGELSSGKTSEINLSNIIKQLNDNGALHVERNRHELRSKEFILKKNLEGKDPITIEKEIIQKNINSFNSPNPKLKNDEGINLAISLLSFLRQDQKMNERKSDYEERVMNSCKSILNLEGIK